MMSNFLSQILMDFSKFGGLPFLKWFKVIKRSIGTLSWVHMSSISGLVSSSINNLFLWWSKIRCVNLEWFEFCKQWKLTSSLHYKALANVKFLLKIEGSHPLWMLRFSNTVTVHCDLLKKIFLVSICDHRFLPIANASDPKCDYQVHCEF